MQREQPAAALLGFASTADGEPLPKTAKEAVRKRQPSQGLIFIGS
jgi:hypothetical protein